MDGRHVPKPQAPQACLASLAGLRLKDVKRSPAPHDSCDAACFDVADIALTFTSFIAVTGTELTAVILRSLTLPWTDQDSCDKESCDRRKPEALFFSVKIASITSSVRCLKKVQVVVLCSHNPGTEDGSCRHCREVHSGFACKHVLRAAQGCLRSITNFGVVYLCWPQSSPPLVLKFK